MNPTLEFRLTRSLAPVRGSARFGEHGDLPPPQGDIDPKCGLAFPLRSGGFMLPSAGIIDDASGALEIAFTPLKDRPNGGLVYAWGQYQPLLELAEDAIRLNVYGNSAEVMTPLRAEKECVVRLSWHHESGFTLVVRQRGMRAQTLRRRLAWKAFRQKYVPFCVGGRAHEPRYCAWTATFNGWVKSLRLWNQPLDAPGPAGVSVAGEPIPVPFKPVANVRILQLDDPPIRPDPLGLVMLPKRPLADLLRTRETANLDRLLEHCKNEIEVLTMLTWYVGNLWPHCNYWPWPPDEQRWIFWKRGHELLPSIQRGEAGGMCGGYAHVMEELCWSLGFDARRIQVKGHSSFEAHSDELDRWIICDASFNEQCHLLADGKGHLLGCADIVRRFETLQNDPSALLDVRQMVCRQENLVESRLMPQNPMYGPGPVQAYDRLGVVMDKTHELGAKTATCRPSRMAWYLCECDREWFRTQTHPTGSPKPILVNNLEDLVPSRNRARVALAWLRPGEVLRVSATPVGVTFFDAFLASVDGAPERRLRMPFHWKLHAGVNTLSLRTLNQLGKKGYPFRISIWRKP